MCYLWDDKLLGKTKRDCDVLKPKHESSHMTSSSLSFFIIIDRPIQRSAKRDTQPILYRFKAPCHRNS